MLRRYYTLLILILVFAIVGTLCWGYFAPKEKTILDFQKERFQALTPDKPEYFAFFHNYQSFFREGKEEQQQRLREIHRHIESDPQSQILKKTLATYHAWLKTVPEEKSKIDHARTIEQRLDVIRAIKENQDRIQGIRERRERKSGSETTTLYPTIYELAEYLEYLESFNLDRLETLLGHEPSKFWYELQQDYQAEK